jgi:SAM-dependent methyltransferase
MRGRLADPNGRIRQHYNVEVELADRLRRASREDRLGGLYASIYRERLERIPSHPLLVRSKNPDARERASTPQLRLVRQFLTPTATFMEVGPGDCSLALSVSDHVKRVYAVDVSDALLGQTPRPQNFEFVSTNGVDIPVAPGSVHIAYSNQVLEHLHPEDAQYHLRALHEALVPGGQFICITPNRLSGPWDISRYFDDVPKGLHLREYTIGELVDLLRACGFHVRLFLAYQGYRLPSIVSERAVRRVERLLEKLPKQMRRPLATPLVAVKVIATKAGDSGRSAVTR